MSTRKRKAAFDPNALNDLDDLLPPLNLVRDAAAAGGNIATRTDNERAVPATQTSTPTVDNGADSDNGVTKQVGINRNPNVSSEHNTERPHALTVVAGDAPSPVEETATDVIEGSVAVGEPASIESDDEPEPVDESALPAARNEADDRQSSPRRADARRKSSRRDSPTASVNRLAPPEVALPHEIYNALRALTLKERSTDPTTARSYGQVVLDAVEEHADELKGHWTQAVTNSGTGLFKRAEAGRPTRRRHNAPQSRVPLAGVINSDAAVLDQLASDWGAGSRSALVEQALRLYLRVE